MTVRFLPPSLKGHPSEPPVIDRTGKGIHPLACPETGGIPQVSNFALPEPYREYRLLQVPLPTRAYCAQTCCGYRHRVHRAPGGNINASYATEDPSAFTDDDGVLEFVASGRRASVEDMARMDCPHKRATAMLASNLTVTCPCVEALRENAAPCGDEIPALADQRLLAVPWSAQCPQKVTMPAATASALNRDMAGRVKRTVHIKSTPMDFVHEAIDEEDEDAPAS